jgi:hypothetical protein
LTADNATSVIATQGTAPAAIRRKFGQGQLYWFGTSLGAGIEAGDQNALELVRLILAAVVEPSVSSEALRPRLIESNGRALLVVCNENAEPQRSSVKVPAQYRSAVDLYSQEKHVVSGQSISVTVPGEGVCVMLLA